MPKKRDYKIGPYMMADYKAKRPDILSDYFIYEG